MTEAPSTPPANGPAGPGPLCTHCGRRPGRFREGDGRLAGVLICDECAATSQAIRTAPILLAVVGVVVGLSFLGWWLLS